jgi:hypothetical protein
MSEINIPTGCEVCGYSDIELFGYRCPPGSRVPFPEGWRWFCAAHRLGRWYADARRWPPQQEDDQ